MKLFFVLTLNFNKCIGKDYMLFLNLFNLNYMGKYLNFTINYVENIKKYYIVSKNYINFLFLLQETE